jgi:hypothetical protein
MDCTRNYGGNCRSAMEIGKPSETESIAKRPNTIKIKADVEYHTR